MRIILYFIGLIYICWKWK